jgi:hypothetical protein
MAKSEKYRPSNQDSTGTRVKARGWRGKETR